jgi:hypothetical protein
MRKFFIKYAVKLTDFRREISGVDTEGVRLYSINHETLKVRPFREFKFH